MQKIGCKQEALHGYLSFIERLKGQEAHTLAEMKYWSQAYYRVSQLYLELKFNGKNKFSKSNLLLFVDGLFSCELKASCIRLEKAQNYMQLYENLQAEYIKALQSEQSEISAKNEDTIAYLQCQFLKRKAWMLHNQWENSKALELLTEVYKKEKR